MYPIQLNKEFKEGKKGTKRSYKKPTMKEPPIQQRHKKADHDDNKKNEKDKKADNFLNKSIAYISNRFWTLFVDVPTHEKLIAESDSREFFVPLASNVLDALPVQQIGSSGGSSIHIWTSVAIRKSTRLSKNPRQKRSIRKECLSRGHSLSHLYVECSYAHHHYKVSQNKQPNEISNIIEENFDPTFHARKIKDIKMVDYSIVCG